jgi:hypothetical protein
MAKTEPLLVLPGSGDPFSFTVGPPSAECLLQLVCAVREGAILERSVAWGGEPRGGLQLVPGTATIQPGCMGNLWRLRLQLVNWGFGRSRCSAEVSREDENARARMSQTLID